MIVRGSSNCQEFTSFTAHKLPESVYSRHSGIGKCVDEFEIMIFNNCTHDFCVLSRVTRYLE